MLAGGVRRRSQTGTPAGSVGQGRSRASGDRGQPDTLARVTTTTGCTSASCCAGRDVARTDPLARQMVNFAYLVGDRETGEAVVVDAAYDVRGIARRRRGRRHEGGRRPGVATTTPTTSAAT